MSGRTGIAIGLGIVIAVTEHCSPGAIIHLGHLNLAVGVAEVGIVSIIEFPQDDIVSIPFIEDSRVGDIQGIDPLPASSQTARNYGPPQAIDCARRIIHVGQEDIDYIGSTIDKVAMLVIAICQFIKILIHGIGYIGEHLIASVIIKGMQHAVVSTNVDDSLAAGVIGDKIIVRFHLQRVRITEVRHVDKLGVGVNDVAQHAIAKSKSLAHELVSLIAAEIIGDVCTIGLVRGDLTGVYSSDSIGCTC